MLLANQILAGIMSLLKSILGKRKFLSEAMFRWRFLNKILNGFFCDEMELPYLYLAGTNKKEFTSKSSLTSFCAESSDKKNYAEAPYFTN